MIAPGIYLDLPAADYHEIPALSNSGIGDLLVSPLTYWHHHINPKATRKADTEFTIFGSAAHCRILTPELFDQHYATALNKADFPSALVTMEDLRTYCEANGLKASAKRKEELVDRIRSANLSPLIWDDLLSRHTSDNQGKTFLSRDEVEAVDEIGLAVFEDPVLCDMVSGGHAEVSIFIEEPQTGRLIKVRIDYLKPATSSDLKTLTIRDGKTFEQAAFEALYYRDYFRQAVLYTNVRREAARQLKAGQIKVHGNARPGWVESLANNLNPGFEFLFVESSAPFNRKAVQVTEYDLGTDQNLYWMRAERTVHNAIHLYDECWSRFGELPWQAPAEKHRLIDSDIPQVSFSR